MALGGTVLKMQEVVAKRISGKFSKIWVAAVLILFVLVGAAVDIRYIYSAVSIMLWFVLAGGICLLLVVLAVLTGVFSGLRCTDDQGELDLSGQLQRDHSYAMLPVVKEKTLVIGKRN